MKVPTKKVNCARKIVVAGLSGLCCYCCRPTVTCWNAMCGRESQVVDWLLVDNNTSEAYSFCWTKIGNPIPEIQWSLFSPLASPQTWDLGPTFGNHGDPLPSLQWIKLGTSNLVCRCIMTSQRKINCSKGAWSKSRDPLFCKFLTPVTEAPDRAASWLRELTQM